MCLRRRHINFASCVANLLRRRGGDGARDPTQVVSAGSDNTAFAASGETETGDFPFVLAQDLSARAARTVSQRRPRNPCAPLAIISNFQWLAASGESAGAPNIHCY
jgi:hypothetical protein